jgi:GNAT superfamily N-acetyltransferase
MIRRCTEADLPVIDAIINEAAQKYRGVIPSDCWHEPYMSRAELVSEIAAGVAFSAWEEAGEVVGVMGIQPVRDVTLIRHAYVRPSHQGRGVGAGLLHALLREVGTRLLVGTWGDAQWAIRFYQQHGFRLVPDDERDRLLHAYWTVSARQREVSVVLDYANAIDTNMTIS